MRGGGKDFFFFLNIFKVCYKKGKFRGINHSLINEVVDERKLEHMG